MITIAQDSEFITDLLPAKPYPAGSNPKCVVFEDADQNPAVLVFKDKTLQVVLTKDEQPDFEDIRTFWNMSKSCTAFDAHQNPDSSLTVVLAQKAYNADRGNIFILPQMLPADLLSSTEEDILLALDLPPVNEVYLSNFTRTIGDTKIPLVFLSLSPSGSSSKDRTLGYLEVTASIDGKTAFTLNTSWSSHLATQPLDILDVTFGTCPSGNGVFVLYQGSDRKHLQFIAFQGEAFVADLQCPASATCIESFTNPATGYTELLVGGDAITLFTYQQYCVDGVAGMPVVSQDTPLAPKEMHATQAGDTLTIWFTNNKDTVFYYSTLVSSVGSDRVVPFLDMGGRISANMLAKEAGGKLLLQTFAFVDPFGSLSLLQSGSDTGIWQTLPFFLPSADNMTEIPSFTLRFAARSDNEFEPVQNCKLCIKSSGAVNAIANGVVKTIDQDGSWFDADSTGVVTLIIQTTNMSSFCFQVTGFQAEGDPPMDISSPQLIPTFKLSKKLAAIKSGDDLLQATTQTGARLIEPGTVSTADAQEAAKAIMQLNQMQLRLSNPDKMLRKVKHVPRLYHPRDKQPCFLAGVLPKTKELSELFVKRLSMTAWYDPWGCFEWIYEHAKQAVGWAIQAVGDAFSFAVQVGKDVYNFFLDSIETIGKAMSWVFAKITVGVTKLIDYIGFVFNWNEILNTSDSVTALINAALGHAQAQVAELKTKEQQWMAGLKKRLNHPTAPIAAAAGTGTKDDLETENMRAIRNSVGYNWVSYQISHGGVAANGSIAGLNDILESSQPGGLEGDPALADIWKGLSSQVSYFQYLIHQISDEAGDFFTSTMTSTDIARRLSSGLLKGALELIDRIANMVLDALVQVLAKFKAVGTATITLPIFGPLWKKITKGRPFTVFNAFSLLIAIPATLLCRAVKGVSPPSLVGMDEKLFAAYVNGLLGDGEEAAGDLGITRSQIALVLVLIAVVGVRLEQDWRLISKAVRKLKAVPAQVVDMAMLFWGTALQVYGWPVKGEAMMTERFLAWGVDCIPLVTLGVGVFVVWTAQVPRQDTTPVVATISALAAVGSYFVNVAINAGCDKTAVVLLRHVTEDTVAVTKEILNGISDVVQDPKIEFVATCAAYGCLAILMTFKFVDFWLAAEPRLEVIGGR